MICPAAHFIRGNLNSTSLPYGISPTPITLTGLVFQALPY